MGIVRMNQKEDDDLFLTGSFTWRIEHFSKLKDWRYSQSFPIGGIKWRILIGPKGKDFSMYLGVADASTLPPGWTKCAHFSLAVVNQLDTKKAIAKPAIGTAQQMFKKKETEWGFGSFMPCSQLYDCSAGYLVDDVCILEAKVEIPVTCEDQETGIAVTMESSVKKELIEWEPSNMNSKLAPEIVVAPKTPCSEVVPNFQGTPGFGKGLKVKILKKELSCARKTENEVSRFTQKKEKEMLPASSGKRVDFKGFGRIEKAFIPLLEDVCSLHPSLILSQMNNSQMIAKSAFRALGRLLHFLKTAKVKDMTEEGCERLGTLYKELEIFGFELAWLEPQVQSAFGMNKLIQRTGRRKRLREDVDVLEKEVKKRKGDIDAMDSEVKRLEIELQRRRATLAVAEDDLEVMKGYLAKVEEDFNGVDMDNELGYRKY